MVAERASSGIRLLLVEDNPGDAELELRELKRAGLHVVPRVVDAADDFVRAIREFAPEVIVSDFSMPQFDGRDDQTMTNASVGAVVQSASGRELTMTYEGGAQKIMVPETASVSTLVPGNRSQLVRGEPVNLTMDANRVALRIQVGPPKH